jgi:hypothetical protein
MPRTTVSPSYRTSLKWGDAATNTSIPISRTTRRPNVKRYILLYLAPSDGALVYQARGCGLIHLGGRDVVPTKATAAHPANCGKLAADVWGRQAVPCWVSCVCEGQIENCFSLPDGVARLFRHQTRSM